MEPAVHDISTIADQRGLLNKPGWYCCSAYPNYSFHLKSPLFIQGQAGYTNSWFCFFSALFPEIYELGLGSVRGMVKPVSVGIIHNSCLLAGSFVLSNKKGSMER